MIYAKDCIITIDAIGCQKDIAKKIIEKEADYILMVKDNQLELKEQIEKLFSIKSVVKTFIKEELDHDRREKRACDLIEDLDFLDGKENWEELQRKH